MHLTLACKKQSQMQPRQVLLVQQDHPETYKKLLESLLALEAASSEVFDRLQDRIAAHTGAAS